MTSSREVKNIDPKTPNNAILLEILINFALKKGEVLLKSTTVYEIVMSEGEEPVIVQSTNDILLSVKEKMDREGVVGLEPHCYVLGPIEKRDGSQNIGIPDILGTLVLNKNGPGMIYVSDESKNKNRLLKIKEYNIGSEILLGHNGIIKNKKEIENQIKSKLNVLQVYTPFHAKSFFSQKLNIKGAIESYTKIRKFKGKVLSEILSEKDQFLSTKDRIRISIALLQEVQILHSYGIIHCDIKPKNIIVDIDREKDTVSVRIVDLDSAKTKDFQGEDSLTTSYASPELIIYYYHQRNIRKSERKTILDKRSDIWQVGLVLAEIWRSQHRDPKWFEQLDAKSLLNEKAMPNLDNDKDLTDYLYIFQDIKDIHVNDAQFNNEFTKQLYVAQDIEKEIINFNLILNTIKKMLQPDKNQRMSDVQPAIDVFEDVRFNYFYPLDEKIAKKNIKNITNLENQRQAFKVRNEEIEELIQNNTSDKLTDLMKNELRVIQTQNTNKINILDKEIKIINHISFISVARAVNFFAKKYRYSGAFNIDLSTQNVIDMKTGFDLLFENIRRIIKNANEENKAFLLNEIKETLHLNTFQDCQSLEKMEDLSTQIIDQFMKLSYKQYSLLLRLKLISQLLDKLTDGSFTEKLSFTTFSTDINKNKKFTNLVISMSKLVSKITNPYKNKRYICTLDDIVEFNKTFENKLNSLEIYFHEMKNQFFSIIKEPETTIKENNIAIRSNEISAYFLEYYKILYKLELENPKNLVDELKNRIKTTIFDYINSVSKSQPISQDRLKDLTEISKILEETDDVKNSNFLIEQIRIYLSEMKTGFLGSSLQKNIESAIDLFQKQYQMYFTNRLPRLFVKRLSQDSTKSLQVNDPEHINKPLKNAIK